MADIKLSDIQRNDARTYVGPAALRMAGKSMRLARLRRNRLMLDAGRMIRPRLMVAAVHNPLRPTNYGERYIEIQYAPRWNFGRGDTFPSADHGRTAVHYG